MFKYTVLKLFNTILLTVSKLQSKLLINQINMYYVNNYDIAIIFLFYINNQFQTQSQFTQHRSNFFFHKFEDNHVESVQHCSFNDAPCSYVRFNQKSNINIFPLFNVAYLIFL